MSLAAALVAEGYTIERAWTRDGGHPALLVKPPSLPEDMAAVSAIIEGAGCVSEPGFPQWMPLRKLIMIVTSA